MLTLAFFDFSDKYFLNSFDLTDYFQGKKVPLSVYFSNNLGKAFAFVRDCDPG